MANADTPGPLSFAGLLLSLFQDRKLFVRGGIAIGMLIVGIWVAVVASALTFRWLSPPLTIAALRSGAIVFTTKDQMRTGIMLLSPNGGNDRPWIDTEMTVQEGQRVNIRATGKVCLAAHRMRQAAMDDSLPPHPWITPDGLKDGTSAPPRLIRIEERMRRPYLVAPDQPQGMLLGIISSSPPSHRPDAKCVYPIGRESTFTAHESGHLWLTVNDVWLDANSEPAYTAGVKHTPEEFCSKIVQNRYWNIWYDDNAGSFQVTIEIAE